jgi:pteridine reductase
MVQQRPVALVTGGAKRVGAAIVRRLAEEGYDVAFTYHSSAAGAIALAEDLKQSVRILPISADLTRPAEAAETIRSEFLKTFNRLDLLVNSASIYRAASLADTDAALLHQLMAIHVESPLALCQKFEKLLRAARGHIVNMLDLLAERPWPKYLAYCSSKAALWNLTLGLARELAPDVTVNGIAPGVVEWPANSTEVEKELYLKRMPLHRAGTPEDVTDAVLFFARSANYVTGQILRLDGGRSIT